MTLRVSSITPRGGQPLTLHDFCVLVGPNNCGKSQTLLDIKDYVTSGSASRLKICTDVQVELPTEAELNAGVKVLPHQNPGLLTVRGISSDLQSRYDVAVQESWSAEYFKAELNPHSHKKFLQHFGRYCVAHLDAEGRFKLAASTDSYDTRHETPSNAMQAFFEGGATALQELRQAFRQAFDMDIALDWAAMRRFELRVGTEFGKIPEERCSLDALLRDAAELANQGDGFKSFAGVVLAMLTFPTRLLLLDEPEAFLHPAQARVLGRWVATNAKKRSAQVMIASHSADFLWGIVSASVGADVIRLNRQDQITTYHMVPSSATAGLVQSPLLSSQPVLDSLFHRGVAVCEGDPDRALYQAVAHSALRESGGEDVLFIHSNGKDAAKTPVELLRQAGAPVCAIVDFDVFNSETVLAELFKALSGIPPTYRIMELRANLAKRVEQVSENELMLSLKAAVQNWTEVTHTDLRSARKALVSTVKQGSKWDTVKKMGIRAFEGEARAEAQELLDTLRGVGLFVVPIGQVESWMSVGYAKGPKWNRAALEKVRAGDCSPELTGFVQAALQYLLHGAKAAFESLWVSKEVIGSE